ncbi:MAG: hypothetical protein K1X72_18525 [Pyrinomonadaceae bacterium]|nr:hypothetical protein [Pyrinomonadaceae bacterium]
MENLKKIRNELLSLHKTLMDIEKENYEAEFGKVTPTQLLQMLFENEKFIWLRTISILVTEFDEMFADKKGIDQELAKSLFEKTKQLFDESDNFAEFKNKFKVNLDTESAVEKHHEKLLNLFKN